jgi:hypothetical protein
MADIFHGCSKIRGTRKDTKKEGKIIYESNKEKEERG